VGLRKRLSRVVYGLYEMRLNQQITAASRRPRHVGVILDGNRRWAKEAGFEDVADGHRAGARKIADLLEWCREADVEVVTLWLLATDNLKKRSSEELSALLLIIADVVDELAEPGNPWRLRVVGALDLLPTDIASRLTAAGQRTANRTGMEVNVAVGYGGRQEIADAVRKLLLQHAEAGTPIEELAEVLDVDHIAEHLYTSGQPDPDLLIRTSGEQRLSGFLLWQSAHSEFWFTEAYWPEFRHVDFLRALRDFAWRHRRYGS
jgi:short-chain Z-isoprenyl diphosphate synthase